MSSTLVFQISFVFLISKCTAHSHDYSPHGRRLWNYPEKDSTSDSSVNQVVIDLFYETLCPASEQYLKEILRPAVEKLGPHLDLRLVPYGLAQTRLINNRYKFQCQHGPAECFGNRLHACSIYEIHNSTKSALFNACLMDNTVYTDNIQNMSFNYKFALTTCSNRFNASSEYIWQCTNSRKGAILQTRHGNRTNQLRPEYVPYVLIDGIENTRFDDLVDIICGKLNPPPATCLSSAR